MRLAAPLLALLVASNASAATLTVPDVVSLASGGLSEAAIGRLIEAQGLTSPLSAADALALREAGLSAEFVSALVIRQAGTGIEVEERDGVTVVSGEGLAPFTPDDAAEEDREDEDSQPLRETIIVAAPEPAPQATNGHPVGATFGWSGGAVFLPARFGGSQPSAFGRTIVGFGSPAGCAPALHAAPVLAAPEPRRVVIHTSRGEIWLPN